MSKPIRKAIFPVAGLGTRFLPATKAMPKEMLTVVDRPIIQHVVDEARNGGIEHFIFVTGRNKGVIEDHFDRQFELEEMLRRRNKQEELLNLERHLPAPGATSFTRQQEPLGLGHAVWCARDIVGEDPFALLLPDVIVLPDGESCLGQMIKVYDQLCEKYPRRENQHRRGGRGRAGRNEFLRRGRDSRPRRTTGFGVSGRWSRSLRVEARLRTSSSWAATSCSRKSSQILKNQERGAGNEIQITDAMKTLMQDQMFFAYKYRGKSYDCGSKLGFLTANVAFALARPDLAPKFGEELKKLAAELQAKHVPGPTARAAE